MLCPYRPPAGPELIVTTLRQKIGELADSPGLVQVSTSPPEQR